VSLFFVVWLTLKKQTAAGLGCCHFKKKTNKKRMDQI